MSDNINASRLYNKAKDSNMPDSYANKKIYHGVLTRPVIGNPLPMFITTTTFTISCATYNITYYYQGTKVIVNTNQSTTIGSTAGLYYIYFNQALGTLLNGTGFPGIDTDSNVIIATVFWNGSDYGLVNDERHGYRRDHSWHIWAHTTVGARYLNGLTLTHNGGTGSGATFALTSGQIADEDIVFDISAKTTARVWYQTGANTYTFVKTPTSIPFYAGANNRPNYVRSDTYATVQMTSVNNRFINIFVYTTTDLSEPLYFFTETVTATIAGTNGYTSIANARAIPFPNLSTMGLSAEYKPIYRLIARADGTIQAIDTTQDDYRTVSSLPMAAGTITPYIYRDGFIDYSHSGTTQSYTSGDLKVLNDGNGAYTLKTYKPIGVTEFWNTTTNQFNFSDLALGDEVWIRTDGLVTTTTSNQIFGTKIKFDIGGTPYDIQVGQSYYKTTGTYPVNRYMYFYIGNTGTLNNPAELLFSSDAAATIQLNGFAITVKRRF